MIGEQRVFQERTVPANTSLVGLSALVHKYGVSAPLANPACVSASSIRGGRRDHDGWTIFENRYRPDDTIAGHLSFALRHEPLDLLALKRIFLAAPQDMLRAEITKAVADQPTGGVSRRMWFFYEWLTDDRLPIAPAETGNYVDAVDAKAYFTSTPVNSARHRVKDNLLGTPAFCPVVRRTAALEEAISADWSGRAKELVGRVSKGLIARAASFLLLADSQASYQIEGERPPRNRLERWMRAVSQAGKRPISVDELVRLQHIVIEDSRFVKRGIREEGGFIGDRDWDDQPLPEFVSARHDDVLELIEGILAASRRMAASELDPVLQASVVAFAFVFVHPFVDGNGRIHRYLIHHVLAERGYTPPGMVFPVSSVLLDRQETYAEKLRAFSGRLLPYIDWVSTPDKNVRVTNDTADLYRFGDYTDLVEFLHECVVRTILEDLPNEITQLARFDEAKARIQAFLEMPDAMISSLVNFVLQNKGTLSKRRRSREFAVMTDGEVEAVEDIVQEVFEISANESEPDGSTDHTP